MTFLQNRGIVRYVSAADSQQERSVFYIGKKRGKEKMTFYQELQLSSVGSKQLIKNTTDKKEKRRHILIYNFKVYLVTPGGERGHQIWKPQHPHHGL